MDEMGEASHSWCLPEGKPFSIIDHGAKVLPYGMILTIYIQKEQNRVIFTPSEEFLG